MSNMDKIFKDAFENYEADFNPAEMNQGWQAVQQQIGQMPNAGSSASGTQAGSVVKAFTAAKLGGIAIIGAVVITAAVLIYNNLNGEDKKTSNTEKIGVVESGNQINNSENNAAVVEGNNDPINENKLTKEDTKIRMGRVLGSSKSITDVDGNNLNTPNNNGDKTIDPSNGDKDKATANDNKGKNENKPAVLPTSLDDTAICANATYQFNAGGTTTIVDWGDGSTSQDNDLMQHKYKRAGVYQVSVKNKFSTCSRNVQVRELQKADFMVSGCEGLTCRISNNTQNANRFEWYFNDGSAMDMRVNPEHSFSKEGDYTIRLKAFGQNGCMDTFIQKINVSGRNKFNMPNNVFTPNGDGINDAFDLDFSEARFFEASIMNSRGEMVYTTQNRTMSWEGNNLKTGQPCATGTYIYLIKYQFGNEPLKTKTGTVTITR
ncbi:MAG: gliding motility-associated C-terminal domain-containing protein [Bacteroidetes bacterium]|nr:gliding motility-associated C-terminal domain-containing protein [Bacteroidota bacterium]